jgi:integrase/recombinase XerC
MASRGQDKAGRWYWRARETGGARSYVWKGRATRDEVTRIVAAMVASEDAGRRELLALRECRTLQHVLELWLGYQRTMPVSPETLHAWEACGRHLVRTIGAIPVDDCRDAARLHIARRLTPKPGQRPGASSTIAREVAVLRSAWKWADDEQLVDGRGPRCDVKVPDRGRVYNHRTPTPDEVEAIIAFLDTPRRWTRWPAMAMRLLYATGARIGEINALRGIDVDLAAATLTLHGRVLVAGVQRVGKTGERVVPIGRDMLERLKPFLPEDPEARVWPVTGRSFVAQIREAITVGCRATGVPMFSPHGLRRAMDDRLAARGPDILSSWMGHSPEMAMRVYRKVQLAELRTAAESTGVAGHSTGAQHPGSENRDPRSTEVIS